MTAASRPRSLSPSTPTSSTTSPPTTSSRAPPRKRARVTLPIEEQQPQVTSLSASHRLDLQDGEVYYVPEFIEEEEANELYEVLLGAEGWYQPKLKMYGKEITQSRKILAFATDRSLVVKYSGTTVDMQYDYPPALRAVQDKVEEKLGVKFNHVMLNLYEDGKVYIGNHRDNKENRVIASLSLGAPRTFILTHDALQKRTTKTPNSPLHHRFQLENGSLVVMQGETQQKWKHEIPKEPKVKEGRISLTFRQLVF